MPDPFASIPGRIIILGATAVFGAIGGGYLTADDVDKRIADARLEGRVEAMERILATVSTKVDQNAREIGVIGRIVDQHGNRIHSLERKSP